MMMVARVATAEHVGSAGASLPQTPGSRSFALGAHPGPQKRIGGPAQGQTAFITPLVTPDGIYSRPSSPYMQASPLLKGSESGGSAGSPQSPDAPSSASGASVGNAIGSGYTGNVSVAIRIKPSESSTKDPWYASNDRLIHTEFGEFQFDHVFTKGVCNQEVYQALGVPIIDKLFEGYNATIFAYGMTGSGKTFTMSGNKQEPGLIPQCVGNIFDRISSEHHGASLAYEVKVSYLEIYNEKIYDLLNYVDRQAGSTGQPSRNATGLKIRDDSKYGVKVVDLTEQLVSSHEDVMKWIATGDRNRKTGETDFNTRSSRSHAIVLLRLTRYDLKTGSEATSTLSLCDLAGSERAVTQIVRRKEGAFINKSLLALGTVIAKLSMLGSQANGLQPSPAAGHIPYRDSKLTRILQPALTGDSIITTICTIDSKAESSTETTNTVRFASRAKNIALNVRKNEMDSHAEKDTIIQNLRKQLDEQHETIVMLRRSAAAPSGNGSTSPLDSPGVGGTSLSERTHNMEKGLLEVENSILKTKLEHCEKLLDKDMMVLEDPHVREIVEMLPLDIASVLESKVQGMESQLRQYRVYVQKLESDLLKAQRNIITTHSVQFNRQSTANVQEKYGSDVDIELLLEEQEAELMELRNALKRKDKMIEALQSARRLRDSALSPTTTVLLQRKESVIDPRDPQPV